MTKTYTFKNKYGEKLRIKANFVEASSPVEYRWEDDNAWHPSPFQVADAQHRPINACKLIASWGR